jgi:hypothetical protein
MCVCVPFISEWSYIAAGDMLVCMVLVMPEACSVQCYSYTCIVLAVLCHFVLLVCVY